MIEAPIASPENKELEELLRSGAHFAYSRSRRHPNMAPFIYGIKNNVEIFDLERVREKLEEAERFLRKLGESKKAVLWVGTKPSIASLVKEIAQKRGSPYVTMRWLGGTLTNAKIIRERIKYFEDLKKKREAGEFEKYTKKEALELGREIDALEKYLAGLLNLKSDVGAMVVVDPGEEKTAFSEALKIKLPTVAILSSDNDPALAAYPIPANDTSPASVGYLLEKLSAAYGAGLASAGEGEEKT